MPARPPISKPGAPRWMRFVLDRLSRKETAAEPAPVGLVDRQRAPAADRPATVAELCGELQARLFAHEEDAGAIVMRHLVCVHDTLGRTGWEGVESLPHKVLAMASLEAGMMAEHEPSPLLQIVVARLRDIKLAVEMREERDAELRDWAHTDIPEVSEGSHEEYDRMERSWIGTVPANLLHLGGNAERP